MRVLSQFGNLAKMMAVFSVALLAFATGCGSNPSKASTSAIGSLNLQVESL